MYEKDDMNNIKMTILLLLGTILILMAIVCKYLESTAIARNNRGFKNLFAITDTKSENQKAYVYISGTPEPIELKTNETAYYILRDDQYMYIAYMNIEDYNKLNKLNLQERSTKLVGTAKKISDELKGIVIEFYNEGKEEESHISINDFDNYFGTHYLDMTNNTKKAIIKDKDLKRTPAICFYILCLSAVIIFVLVIQEIKKN